MHIVELKSGSKMPMFGLGTWQLTGDDAASGVLHALEIGYRLIDTSGDYDNQRAIGEALDSSPVSREVIFLTSKVEEDEDAYSAVRDRIDELGVEYLDLCLIHRPPAEGSGPDLWRGLIEARRDGLTRAIGVSNYTADQVDDLIAASDQTPEVNQIEWSPFGHDLALLNHAHRRGMVLQAYSPLTRTDRLTDPTLTEIAAAHSRTPAQVMLRWCVQLRVAAVAKAASAVHREENFAIFDFELTDEEIRQLGDLNEHYSSLAGLPYV